MDSLVGLPYVPFARGPESFDCWGICYYIMRQRGLNIPVYPISPYDKESVIRAFSTERGKWIELKQPESGCVVLLGRARVPNHCGMWENGRVLHCFMAGGVVSDSVAQLAIRGLKIMGYYKWQN